MADAEQLTWRQDFRVRAYETGADGRVKVQSIFNYLIEAAVSHATHLGVSVTDLFAQGQTWVLSRMHLQVTHFPLWPAEIRIETWPSGRSNLFALREFEIADGAAGAVGVATSSWMIIDKQSRRPIRIPPYFDDFTNHTRGRMIDSEFPQLPQPERCDGECRFRVRKSDLDINQHVYAGHYIEWALESIPETVWQGAQLRALEIDYRAESVFGDHVQSCCQVEQEKGGYHVVHRLLKEGSQRELTRLVTHWQEI